MPNLLPCPFCGSGNVAVLGAVSCYGQCRDCGASSGLAESPEAAAELWNRRATPNNFNSTKTEVQSEHNQNSA